MSDTSSQKKSATRMKPGIVDSQVKMGVVVPADHSTAILGDRIVGDFVVHVLRDQKSIALKLNTRLMAEQRENERANDAISRSDR